MAKRPPPAPLPSADDVAFFHEAIGPVRRIEEKAPPPRQAPPPPRPISRERDEVLARKQLHFDPFIVSPLAAGDVLEYLREGHTPRLLRQLKRGEFAVQDELDLHRLTQSEAEQELRNFLHHARYQGRRCVRVIHGKGLRSGDQGPVLKNLVDRMLRLRGDVMAFASAPEAQGGSGAVVVLLKRL